MHKKNKKILIISLLCVFIAAACSTKKSVKYRKKRISPQSSIAVIINYPDNLKNVVMIKFMKKGFNVKAVNASDFYSIEDVFDIKDLHKMAYNTSSADSLAAMEKTYNNIYKLHIYNFEINKAKILSEMRDKWGVDYLVLLDLQDWENTSWGRLIDLRSNEILWIENYSTKYKDNIESITDYFITSMTGRK